MLTSGAGLTLDPVPVQPIVATIDNVNVPNQRLLLLMNASRHASRAVAWAKPLAGMVRKPANSGNTLAGRLGRYGTPQVWLSGEDRCGVG